MTSRVRPVFSCSNSVLALALLLSLGTAYADVALGPVDFNSAQFGNTLLESDGSSHSAHFWLNVVNMDPGNPAYLTGANFNTGIANIGLVGFVSYTIGYSTSIVNKVGVDLGVVVARYSNDFVTIAFSRDGGATFTHDVSLSRSPPSTQGP
jgi:hypothetical protein